MVSYLMVPYGPHPRVRAPACLNTFLWKNCKKKDSLKINKNDNKSSKVIIYMGCLIIRPLEKSRSEIPTILALPNSCARQQG